MHCFAVKKFYIFGALALGIAGLAMADGDRGPNKRFLDPIAAHVTHFLGIEDRYDIKGVSKTCAELPNAEFSFEACALFSYFKQKVQPLDLAQFSKLDSQVVYFGETHSYQSGKITLRRLLPALQAAGYNTLAMEMFEASDQPAIEDFLSGKISDEEIRTVLESEWTYESDNYLALIVEAKALGFKILALNNHKLPKEGRFADNLHRRDLFMAERITTAIRENPATRIVAFTGGLHAVCGWTNDGSLLSQPEILVKTHGLKVNCFSFTSRQKEGLMFSLLKEAKKKGDLFLPLPRDQAFFDGLFLLD